MAIQIQLLNLHLAETFEYTPVCNDDRIVDDFHRECRRLGVTGHVNTLNTHVKGSTRPVHSDALNYAWQNLRNVDVMVLLDSDMFLTEHYSVVNAVRDCPVSAQKQNRGDLDYPHPGLFICRPSALPSGHELDFDGGDWHGLACDTGGKVGQYLRRHEIPVRWMNHAMPGPWDFERFDDAFLHFRAGSNWIGRPQSEQDAKLQWIKDHYL